MASKIPQVAALLAGMDKYELESVKSVAGQEIQTRPTTTCKLLDLPPELRNRIYSFVAAAWKKYIDYFCRKQNVKEIQIACASFAKSETTAPTTTWKPFGNRKILRPLLTGNRKVEVRAPRTMDEAQRSAERQILSDARRAWHEAMSVYEPTETWTKSMYGILELTGYGDKKFAPFEFDQELFELMGLEQELEETSSAET